MPHALAEGVAEDARQPAARHARLPLAGRHAVAQHRAVGEEEPRQPGVDAQGARAGEDGVGAAPHKRVRAPLHLQAQLVAAHQPRVLDTEPGEERRHRLVGAVGGWQRRRRAERLGAEPIEGRQLQVGRALVERRALVHLVVDDPEHPARRRPCQRLGTSGRASALHPPACLRDGPAGLPERDEDEREHDGERRRDDADDLARAIGSATAEQQQAYGSEHGEAQGWPEQRVEAFRRRVEVISERVGGDGQRAKQRPLRQHSEPSRAATRQHARRPRSRRRAAGR